jgi:hypothetical protein
MKGCSVLPVAAKISQKSRNLNDSKRFIKLSESAAIINPSSIDDGSEDLNKSVGLQTSSSIVYNKVEQKYLAKVNLTLPKFANTTGNSPRNQTKHLDALTSERIRKAAMTEIMPIQNEALRNLIIA